MSEPVYTHVIEVSEQAQLCGDAAAQLVVVQIPAGMPHTCRVCDRYPVLNIIGKS